MAMRTAACAISSAAMIFFQHAAQASGTVTVFDVPGAGTAAGQGTYAETINDKGAITGYWLDSNSVNHGFVRAPNGKIRTFDVVGAGTRAGRGTIPKAIGPDGTVTGVYLDDTGKGGIAYGFVRLPSGQITAFSAPHAALEDNYGTVGDSVNWLGEVAGFYCFLPAATCHGYLRASSGEVVEWAPPGSSYTFLDGYSALNAAGDVCGVFADSKGVLRGFIRDSDGKFSEFDAPGAGDHAGVGTYVWSINDKDDTDGTAIDNKGVGHGYTHHADGTFEPFDATGAGTAAGQGTFADGNNHNDDISGTYQDSSGVYHAYKRVEATKVIDPYDAPGAGTGAGQGTVGAGINDSGAIAGWEADSSNVVHGFVATGE